jgi:hypothetical protein
MPSRRFAFVVLAAIVTLWGCRHPTESRCKPALFPYIQYNYEAAPIILGQFHTQIDAEKSIELFNLRLSVPEGWTCEKVFAKSFKFASADGRVFLLSFEKDVPFTDSTEGFRFIGCDDFKSNKPATVRSKKDYYTGLYLFTADQLSDDPIFWEYYILWSKTEIFRDSLDIFHFKGGHLEGFQRNIDPNHKKGAIECEIVIFPNKIAPDFITIASRFTDDPFFASFVDMLDSLNH